MNKPQRGLGNQLSIFALEKAIEALLREYIDFPLRYLREYNQQVRLVTLVASELGQAELATDTVAEVVSGTGRKPEGQGCIWRPQIEAKVKDAEGEASDLVLLREADEANPILLERKGNGHLDIVATVRAEDVIAVVEIKAACSADDSQRHLFRRDVLKLFELQRRAKLDAGQISCHFVLIDKSLPMGGFKGAAKSPQPDWHQGPPPGRFLPPDNTFESSPQLVLHTGGTEDVAGPYVHVWDVEDQNGVMVPRHRICTGFTLPPAGGLKVPVRRQRP
jgi:hypothetical protein